MTIQSGEPNFLSRDPRETADRVADAELAIAIAWTSFYLDALRQRSRGEAPRRAPVPRDPQIERLDTDCDLPLGRVKARHCISGSAKDMKRRCELP